MRSHELKMPEKPHIRFKREEAEEYAKRMEKLIRWRHKPLAKKVVENLSPLPDKPIILDVGTGPGFLAVEIGKLVPEAKIVGLDISQAMLDIAERKTREAGVNFEVKKGAAEEMPVESRSADSAVSSNSLHEFENPKNALAEVFRVLKPGGKLFISDFNPAYPGWKARLLWFFTLLAGGKDMASGFWRSRRQSYRLEQVIAMCREAGFSEIGADVFGHNLFVQALKKGC